MRRTLGLTSGNNSQGTRAGRTSLSGLLSLASGLLALGAVTACGDASTGESSAEDPATMASDDDGPAPMVGGGDEPPDNSVPSLPTFDPDPQAGGLTVVTGRAVVEDGTPVEEGSFMQVCGSTCFPGSIGADGAFTVSLSVDVSTEPFAVSIKGGSGYAKFYFALPADSTTGAIDMGDLSIFPLPATGEAIPQEIEADRTFTSGGVSLDLAAGTEVNLDFDALIGGELGASFRVGAYSGAEVGDALSFDADHFFAFAPFETTFSANDDDIDAQLTFELEGAADGAEFEVYALGSYLFPEFLPAAQFSKIGDVVADAEGRVVVDEGVSLLTWVAFVAK